ncbi:MAG: hypothetical protein H7A35_04975 [Planctomycetales bacterium]|nr:hypothetical protein [bacterium]UNM09410.1 MAG: hypothetical protein H7A35_04975 [Planctomycetales bacterium]
MRKVIFAAMIVAALTVFAGGTSTAWAGCGCKDKCGCSQKADCGCKDKCGCEKPKCGKCESKCGCEKPKCNKCESKCGCSKPKCNKCENKCGCESKSKCGCSSGCDCCVQKVAQNHHPYECQYRGSSMVCDMGCCSGPICIPKCEVCTTTCTKKECTDSCGCSHVTWESHTTCGAPERPRTIPWWFNIEAGTGNIYLEGDEKWESASEEGGEEMASAEKSSEKSETVESSEA